jgi:hypothetical protein
VKIPFEVTSLSLLVLLFSSFVYHMPGKLLGVSLGTRDHSVQVNELM